MKNIGLVLEGGGMRGLYTCGVLEFFMEKDLYFNYVIGVSAGACNAVSYISRQKGRNKKVNIDLSNSWKYMSFRNFIREKSFIGMNYIFDEIPNKHVKFDFETFSKAPCKFLVGATDCNTGTPLYFNKEDVSDGFYALRATSSLPFISPIVNFKEHELLDGGITDSIPIVKSIKDGNSKNIIILTRHKEYRKTPMRFTNLAKIKYKKYPLLINALLNRYKKYNETLDYIEQLEMQGKAIVIRHSEPLNVGRLERDPKKLLDIYNKGYEDAKNSYDRIIKFIENQ
ncbi:MAG: putative esterase of the alpha-beta hydrolase superfamily [Clostridiaceae bacterium]|nr:putative esterase of the alpha-beta hydrolase superfamily [Clostridiaceae bacterium]